MRLESGPHKTDYRSDYIYLVAPEIRQSSPAADVARSALQIKLKNFRQATESRDFRRMQALVILPAEMARALIQNVASNQSRQEWIDGHGPAWRNCRVRISAFVASRRRRASKLADKV